MKKNFPGYFKEKDSDQYKIWNESIIALDANIILNLYRYSDSTRREFVGILKKIKDRIWLPHRSAEEYLNNRLSVIDQQEKVYESTIKSIRELKEGFESARQHPFLSKESMEKMADVFDALCDELNENKSTHSERIYNDNIKEEIAEIFNNKVGDPYEKSRLEEIIQEGVERYKQRIPPGFKDSVKSVESDVFSDKCRVYGDLIVWNQIIDKAIESSSGVVFITDDKKEDWWERFKGKTMGPLPALVKEFQDRTGQKFTMYQSDRFLELAKEQLGQTVSDEAVKEIREVRRLEKMTAQEVDSAELRRNIENDATDLLTRFNMIERDINSLGDNISVLETEIRSLEYEKEFLKMRANELSQKVGHDGRYLDNSWAMDQYKHVLEKINNNKSKIKDLYEYREVCYMKQKELQDRYYRLTGRYPVDF